jgi:hypothetical protein
MTFPSPRRERDLGLIDLVDRLADEFPDLPVGTVLRCAQAARAGRGNGDGSDAGRLEETVRADLRQLEAALAVGPGDRES